ncbi:MAG: recombination protein RecR [Lentisphaeria bacterium]|nr:recombination protein RecR [Lentisphaeria bacterium]
MNSSYPEPLEELMSGLRQLPGIGRRAAERLALALWEWDREELRHLGTLIAALPEKVGRCPECAGLTESGELCHVCRDEKRDNTTLCVVESMSQMLAVEAGGHYRGRYLVLGGKISPLDGEDGSGLNLELLLHRVQNGEIKEVILALSSDVEGRATAVYIAELLQKFPVRISRPASGLPAGANLSYADGATIAAAFAGRTALDGKQ